MTKQLRSILILALVVIVLGAAYFFLNSRRGIAEIGTLAVMKPDEAISHIIVQNKYGSFSFAQSDDDMWYVELDGHSYRANDEKIQLLLAALEGFPITRVLEEELPEYGLSSPRTKVSFATSKGNDYGFALGNETAGAGNAYIRDQFSEKVMVTTTSAVAQMTGSLSAYRSKQVLTVDSANLRSIVYYQGGEKIVAVGNNGAKDWFMTYPYEAPARLIELNELTSKMRKWNIAGYPEMTDPAKLGVEGSGQRLELTDANGNTQSVVIGNSDGGTGTYVRIGGGDEIVTLYTVDLDFSVLHPDKLVFVTPLKTTADKLSAIRIETLQETFELNIEQIAGGQRVTSGGKEISAEDFASVFFKYIAMNADGRDPSLVGNEIAAVLTSTFTDGTTAQITLVLRDEKTYYMLLDGKTEYYLSTDDLEQLLYRTRKALA